MLAVESNSHHRKHAASVPHRGRTDRVSFVRCAIAISCFALCLSFSTALGGTSAVSAVAVPESDDAPPTNVQTVSVDTFETPAKQGQSGPYCGVASVYTCLRAFGLNLDYAKLLYPKYIGNAKGSSSAELMQAVRDHGAAAMTYTGLGAGALRASKDPIILHVSDRQGIQPNNFNHLIVLLGSEGGKAKVWELGFGTEMVEFPWLLSRSDGIGIIVSPVATSQSYVLWNGRYNIAIVLSAIGALFLCSLYPIGWLAGGGNTPWLADLRGVALLVGVSVLIGILWNRFDADGLLIHQPVLEGVSSAYFAKPIERIQLADLKSTGNIEKPVYVDARLRTSFVQGAIPGAVNIEPDAGPWNVADEMAAVDKDSLVVVYCQSKNCGFSDIIGRHLVSAGFSNVRVFEGGWTEWQDAQKQEAASK